MKMTMWPVEIEVDVQFPTWKCPRRGVIKQSKVHKDIYCFYYQETPRKQTFRQMSEPVIVTIVSTGEVWDPHQGMVPVLVRS